MVVLGVFAGIGSLGYLKTLESLLAMATLYCSFVAAFRREAPFGPALTHFDEAAAYALIACVVGWGSAELPAAGFRVARRRRQTRYLAWLAARISILTVTLVIISVASSAAKRAVFPRNDPARLARRVGPMISVNMTQSPCLRSPDAIDRGRS